MKLSATNNLKLQRADQKAQRSRRLLSEFVGFTMAAELQESTSVSAASCGC